MIFLAATTDKLKLVTSTAATIDVQANYVDASSSTLAPSGAGRQNTATSSATTTDVLGAPAASTVRTLKQMTVRNKDASLSGDVTLQYEITGPATFDIHKATLLPGETLMYIEGVPFFVIKASVNDQRALTTAESSTGQRVMFSQLERAAIGTFLLVSGTAYYVYVGRIVKATTVKFVEALLTTNAAGTVAVELGLFSTPNAPGKSTQTLTKIAATGTVDSLTAGATKAFRNTSSFAQNVDAGTHLWAAMRAAFGTTQPTCGGLAGDFSQAHILTTTGGGALTGLTTANGTIPAVGTATVAPDLRVTID